MNGFAALVFSIVLSVVHFASSTPADSASQPGVRTAQGAASVAASGAISAQVRRHPLYAVVQQYDREIAALRATQAAPGLTRIPQQVDGDRAALVRDANGGSNAAQAIAARYARTYPQRERSAIDALLADPSAFPDAAALRARVQRAYGSQDAGFAARASRDMRDYDGALSRQASASMADYRRSTALRTERAYASREAQLREKESTLAFDEERRNGGRRLLLELKLQDLHRDRATRAGLLAQLDALDARVRAAVERMRAQDAATLAAYRGRLQALEASDDARMAAELQAASAGNRSVRQSVLQAQERARGTALFASPLPAASPGVDLRARAQSLRAQYAPAGDADTIANAFAGASADVGRRFDDLRASDDASARATASTIAALEADRRSVLAEIVADVARNAHGRARPNR